MNVYALRIEEFQPSKITTYLNFVSHEKRERLRRIRQPEEFRRVLYADLLARAVICENLGITNAEIEISFTEYGKPLLKGADNFHYNVSHSGEWVVCIAGDKPVGIDVELIQPIDYAIALEFFSPGEYRELMNKDQNERLKFFYVLWTLKESYVKAKGCGLLIPLSSFTIMNAGDAGAVLKYDNSEEIWYFTQYNIDVNYNLAVCASRNEFPEKVIFKQCKDIFHY